MLIEAPTVASFCISIWMISLISTGRGQYVTSMNEPTSPTNDISESVMLSDTSPSCKLVLANSQTYDDIKQQFIDATYGSTVGSRAICFLL